MNENAPLFKIRYYTAQWFIQAGLTVMPESRVRRETWALLRAYRSGVEAAVLLASMRQLAFFDGSVPVGLDVADVLNRIEAGLDKPEANKIHEASSV